MALPTPTSPTTRTTANDIFNTEYITRSWRTSARRPKVGLEAAKIVSVPLEELNSLTYQVPVVTAISGVTTVTAGSAAPEAAVSTDGVTITLARRGLSVFLHDDVRSKVMAAGQVAMAELLEAMQQEAHNRILALLTSITTNQGNNATVNDLANWESAAMAHRANLITGGPLMAIMNPDAVRDMRQDLIANAAALFGSAWGERAADAVQKPQTGLFTSFDGYAVRETLDTPAGDTTGWTNALVVVGDDAWAEFVIGQDIEAELERAAQFYGTWMVAGSVTGTGIVKQTQAHRFITQT